jgi:predicted solute-binding protein
MIPYTNMAPYRQLGPPRGCRFVPVIPRASIGALLSGEVVAAAVPVGGLKSLDGVVETVGRFGIAADGECMSVLFFSRLPFEEMHAPRTIRVTGESASSVRLLYLLLGSLLGFSRLPHVAAAGQVPDGELLIGDRALVKGQTAGDAQSLIITDLSRKWVEIHRLPFVFARWVVRKDASERIKSALSDWLDAFKAREPLLVDQAVPQAAEALHLPPAVIRRYFQVIRRSLDDRDIRGQQLFLRQIEALGRSPLFQPAVESVSRSS